MRGEVQTFDQATGLGAILGDDGQRYLFGAEAVRFPQLLRSGDRVDFVPADGQATDVMMMGPAALNAQPQPQPMRGPGFDLGRVIQKTFTVIASRWKILLPASAILVGIPSVIAGFGQSTILTSASATSVLVMIAGGLLTGVGGIILQGVVVKVAVDGLHGKASRFSNALEVAAAKFLPLLGLAIVMGLSIGLGLIFFLVPGLILMVLWAVAAPSVVVEKRGIFEAMQRSRDLTRGHRWSVFGLMVIYFVVSMIIGMAAGALSIATGGTFSGMGASPAAGMIVGPITNIITGVVSSAGVAALYHELRVAKEGGVVEDVASVFD